MLTFLNSNKDLWQLFDILINNESDTHQQHPPKLQSTPTFVTEQTERFRLINRAIVLMLLYNLLNVNKYVLDTTTTTTISNVI